MEVNRLSKNDTLKKIYPPVALVGILILYLPFIPFISLNDSIYDSYSKFYLYVSPFFLGHIIVGLISLSITIYYKNPLLKLVFGVLYGLTVLISLVAIMGYSEPKDLLIFVPQVIMILMHVIIWIYQFEQYNKKI